MGVPDLTAEQALGARAIDVLTSLSDKSLSDLRRPSGDPRQADRSYIPRDLLRDLLIAVETAYPGVIDMTLEAGGRKVPG